MGFLAVLSAPIIDLEIAFRQEQSQYFLARAVTGPVIEPRVFLPVLDPVDLLAVLVEPGAVHLVFADEVHPDRTVDEQYRKIRWQVWGRAHDVESAEVRDGKLHFVGSSSFGNLYETSIHGDREEAYEGAVYSNTWNHLLSAKPEWPLRLRGGYREVKVAIMRGSRADAENW